MKRQWEIILIHEGGGLSRACLFRFFSVFLQEVPSFLIPPDTMGRAH